MITVTMTGGHSAPLGPESALCPCTGCGLDLLMPIGQPGAEEQAEPDEIVLGPGTLKLQVCSHCGHSMVMDFRAHTVRNLTREEADRAERSGVAAHLLGCARMVHEAEGMLGD